MRNGIALAALCWALAVAALPASASAADAYHFSCTAEADWSLSLSSATVTYTDVFCATEEAHAALQALYPEWELSGGKVTPPPYTWSIQYDPIQGPCLGVVTPYYPGSTTTYPGLLKNDGNQHTLVAMKGTAAGMGALGVVRAFEVVETHAGVLQLACSDSFQATATWTLVEGTNVP